MSVLLVWEGNDLTIPACIGTACSHQFLGSKLDNLVELAGRICYDSVGSEKSRNSHDYHKHIVEVNHTSVHEHAVFTVQIPEVDPHEFAFSMLNRPGVWVEGFRLTTNLRTVREWDRFGVKNKTGDWIGQQLKRVAKKIAPLVMFDHEDGESEISVVKPLSEQEKWATVLFYDLSRGFSHELVRHGDFTAISQRSTRYVDESKSDWAWHPLLKQLEDKDKVSFLECEKLAKESYKEMVSKLEKHLIQNKGIDKFTSRKQARGAARGVLGNALSTEIIFSASISQWKWMMNQRAAGSADGEIRLAFNDVFDILSQKFDFSNYLKKECEDGIGYEIEKILVNKN